MTRAELINELAARGNCTRKEAEATLNLVTDVIVDAIANGEKVHLNGLGTFDVRDRKAKETVNPRTGAPMITTAKKAAVFRPAKGLKEVLNS